jgi:hypothetical protein
VSNLLDKNHRLFSESLVKDKFTHEHSTNIKLGRRHHSSLILLVDTAALAFNMCMDTALMQKKLFIFHFEGERKHLKDKNTEKNWVRTGRTRTPVRTPLWRRVIGQPGSLASFATVGDSPGGPLKQLGKPHLKPAKSQSQTRLV